MKEALMSKIRWASTGAILLGACFVQAMGCGSDSGGTAGPQECCSCTITEATASSTCTAMGTFRPPTAGADCTTFCTTAALKCSSAPPATITRTASGGRTDCPAGLADAGGEAVVHPVDGGSSADLGIAC